MSKPHRVLWRRLFLAAAILCSASSVFAEDSPVIGLGRGEMAPDFCLPDLDGKLHRLSDYRGKKVFLFHFASW